MNQHIFKLRKNKKEFGWEGKRKSFICNLRIPPTKKKKKGILLAHIKIATIAEKNVFTLKRTVAVLKITFVKVLFIIIATVYSYN